MLRVLIGCEFSGVVRNAFVRAGHDAMSCDLLDAETERPDGWDGHYRGDVLDLLADKSYSFDLAVFHPPCTYLCNSGVRWLAPGGKLNKDRHKLMMQACDFFAACYYAKNIKHVAVENPIMHCYARDYLDSKWKIRAEPQIVQPWWFGHKEMKATCLHLRNLPPLTKTNDVGPPPKDPAERRKWARVHQASPGPDRWKERSRTLQGPADAMAAQWGQYVEKEMAA